MLELTLSRPSFTPQLNQTLKHGGFLACWQVQSKLATFAMFGLIAVSVWLALGIMMVWSVIATVVYFVARERGMPDMLAGPQGTCHAAKRTGHLVGRLWLVGLNALAFTSIFRPIVSAPAVSSVSKVARGFVLGTGLVLFGVTTAQHMLHCAGYRGPQLLAISIAGSFVNIPYRVFCGAITLHLVLELINLQMPSTYI